MTVAYISEALAQCGRCAFCVGAEHSAEFLLFVPCALPPVRRLHRQRVAPPQQHARTSPQEVCRILHYTTKIAHSHPAQSHSPPLTQTRALAHRRSGESRITPEKSLTLRTHIPHPSRKRARRPTGGQANSALHHRNCSLSPSALTFPTPHANTLANFTCAAPINPYASSQSYPNLLASNHPLFPSTLACLFPGNISVKKKKGVLARVGVISLIFSSQVLVLTREKKLVSWNGPSSFLRNRSSYLQFSHQRCVHIHKLSFKLAGDRQFRMVPVTYSQLFEAKIMDYIAQVFWRKLVDFD